MFVKGEIMAEQPCGEFVLGIDLGTNSVGWAMVGLVDGEPAKLLRAGVRVFDAGMEGDIESGQEQSKNLKRREARSHRRQLWRRARRMTKTFNLLRQFAPLPGGR
jgi:CRISPR-associated endonuclease Csn1